HAPRKGPSRQTPVFLPTNRDRWTLILLQRGRPKRRADAPHAARISLVIADVRASICPTFRSLSPRRAGLPRLRTQRLAGSEKIRLLVRLLRCDHESLHRSDRALALHALHAGLRRPGGFPHGLGPSGPHGASQRPERCGTQRGPGSDWEAAPSFLARPPRKQKHFPQNFPIAADDTSPPRRQRSERVSLRS